MKTVQKLALVFALLALIAVCVCACGGKESDNSVFTGKWGYIHDPETAVLSFKGNKVEYEGEKYSFTSDDTCLYLTSGSKTVSLRYMISGKHFYIYQTTEYEYAGTGSPEGLVGRWENPNKWNFEFTADGEFVEDGYFPGQYSSDDKTFKLMYTDHFEDTVCYYTIRGMTLTVEYPWEMARPE